MGKSTISMANFNSYFDITRGYPHFGHDQKSRGPWSLQQGPWGNLPPGGDADFHVALDHLLGNVLAFPLLQLGLGEYFLKTVLKELVNSKRP